MKNIRYLIIGLIAALSFVTCDDESFLEEQAKTIYTTSTAFEQSSQVDAQLVTAYSSTFGLYGINGFPLFGNTNCVLLHGQGSDVMDMAHIGIMDGSDITWSNYASWSSTDGRYNSLWNSLYQLVSYANLALFGAEEVSWINASDKDYAIAQAKFFRGYAYLRLAECFGGVPIVDKFEEKLKLDFVRATREETYQFAIDDFIDAAADLPDYPEQDGRVAKGVAYHFLAEAYLGLGVETDNASGDCYTNAIDAATQTINLHPLMTARFGSRAPGTTAPDNNGVAAYKPDGNVFYDLFQIGNYDYSAGNTESVWVMEAGTYDQQQAFSSNPFGPSLYYSPTNYEGPVFRNMVWIESLQELDADIHPFAGENIDLEKYPGGSTCAYLGGFAIGGSAETQYLSTKVWADEFADDMRNDSINICREFVCLDTNHSRYGTVVQPDEIQHPRMMFPLRSKIAMQDDWGWHSSQLASHTAQYRRDWYAVRSAETYLLRAEAYLRSSQPDEAADDINTIRNRALASKTFTPGEVDIYTILDERARELAFEEHRWPTLLRMGSSTANGGQGSNEVMYYQLTNNALFVADVPLYPGPVNWTLFPIPQTAIDANIDADLTQNYGY